MNNRISILSFFALVFVITLFGCERESEEKEESEEKDDSETMSIEADVEALNWENRKYDDTYSSGDLDGFMALFTSDAVQMPNDAPIIVGRHAIRSRAKEGFANNTFKLTDTIEDIKVSGNWAYVRGNFTNITTPKDGGTDVTQEGKWIAVYQRQSNGTWKLYSEIWNNNAPSQ